MTTLLLVLAAIPVGAFVLLMMWGLARLVVEATVDWTRRYHASVQATRTWKAELRRTRR